VRNRSAAAAERTGWASFVSLCETPIAPVPVDAHQILHADEALVVLAKPSGLLSVPGRGPDKQDALSTRVQREFADALIVHRLDMATSGLMLMARGPAAQRALSMAFEQRQINKRYEAVVNGLWPLQPDENDGWGQIDLPIRLDWLRRPLSVVDLAAGKPSCTRWRVLSHDAAGARTRLALEPVTGRSHQLRLHLAAQGHPILGDALYAPEPVRCRAPRLLLHACSIEVAHPVHGGRLRFNCPAPF
jgi:tRNA pseudouridine32 synthase/23S rRNA pseudouridine746 synthase